MADVKKSSYPMLPVNQWWKLREKFKQTIPPNVSDTYLAAALDMKVGSARNNIMPYLKAIGLIDEDSKTNQDLAKAWRDDGHYPDVCKQIKERIYSQELIAAVHSPLEDRAAVERWFANHTGSGESAVKKMDSFYIMLSEADATKKPEKKAVKEKVIGKQKPASKVGHREQEEREPEIQGLPANVAQETLPSININLEIHISPDFTPEQIDKIFESIAKHIYKR